MASFIIKGMTKELMNHEQLNEFIKKHQIDLYNPKKEYKYGKWGYIKVLLFNNCALIHKDTVNAYYGYEKNEINQAFIDAKGFNAFYGSGLFE